MPDMPRITFGIIVLNGEPFTRYNLRALYPFAHEIIVVEGAAPAAANVATEDGHSIDGTLEVLHQFKAEEDPENKIQIVTRDGFWTEKDEMSQAYASRATGDYLWQVDMDEFYQPEDMRKIINMLRDDPEITAMSFKMLTFWGSPDYITDGWYLRRGANIYHRLFKWGAGYSYIAHRPPTVVNAEGGNLRDIKWVNGRQLAKQGILMYHYSLLFPKQVVRKSDYVSHAYWNKLNEAQHWADAVYLRLENPFRVHNVYELPSWLERFKGTHPEQISQMWQDVKQGKFDLEVRQTDDIERVLNSPTYQIKRYGLKHIDDVLQRYNAFQRSLEPIKNPVKRIIRGRNSQKTSQYLPPKESISDNRHMLNIGCGHRYHRDWTNIDLSPATPDVIGYNILKGLPFETGSFDVVYHSHILEHLSRVDGQTLMQECYRVLKPGGVIRVVVPDLAYSCRLYLQCLDEVRNDPQSTMAREHYEWAVLNLIDQMARSKPGGAMADFLNQSTLEDKNFIINAGGGSEIRHMLDRQMTAPKRSSLLGKARRLTPGKLIGRIQSSLTNFMASDTQREMRFRRSGEIHKWMYDEFSLSELMRQIGWQNIQSFSAQNSQISGWSEFHLDVDNKGRVHKPESLFIEATKPG